MKRTLLVEEGHLLGRPAQEILDGAIARLLPFSASLASVAHCS